MDEDIKVSARDRILREAVQARREVDRKARYLVTRNEGCSGASLQGVTSAGHKILRIAESYEAASEYARRYLGRPWRARIFVDIWDSAPEWNSGRYAGRWYTRMLRLRRDGSEEWQEPVHRDSSGNPHTPFRVMVPRDGDGLIEVCRRCSEPARDD